MPFNSIERLIDFSLNCCSRLFSEKYSKVLNPIELKFVDITFGDDF
jgi:hypothetical protein